jgi:uncharacterized protein (TIGR04255 family)
VGKSIKLHEIYPKSPLREVICEITFPGEISVETQREKFYSLIRKRYPDIYVPQIEPGKHAALQPYRFEKHDRSAGVAVALNRYSYYERGYTGHKKFIGEFRALASLIKKLYGIEGLNRVGWRYINVVPYVREKGLVPLNEYLRLSVVIPGVESARFEHVALHFTLKTREASVTTRIASLIDQSTQQEALLVDFDCFVSDGLTMSKLAEGVKKVHLAGREMFENIITENYRSYLRGETLGNDEK